MRHPDSPIHALALLPLLLLLAAPPVAAGEGAVGVWDLELELNGRAVPVELSIWEEEGALLGSWSSPRGTNDLSDVQFSEGSLTFQRQVEFQGQSFELSFEGTVDGDELSGSFATPQGSMPVKGTRSAGDATAAKEEDTEAEPIAASDLPASEAAEFLANWALQMDFNGNAVEMNLRLSDQDGKVAALLSSPQGDQVIEDITRTEEGLKLAFDSSFGALVIALALEGDELKGTFGDENGSFSADFSGSKAAVGRSGRRRRGGAFGGRPSTSIELSDKQIKIYYDAAKSEELAQLAGAADEDVVSFTEFAAIKLLTELDLVFGDVTVRQGNVHEEYPGVYSLWLKKAGDDWHLVFNAEADIWGTMHDPAADTAEVPLVHRAGAEAEETLLLELKEEEGGGELGLAWGEHRWSARFSVAQ